MTEQREYIGSYEVDGNTMFEMRTNERIVRCRDCKFFNADVSTVDVNGSVIATGNVCEWTELWVERDGFCAWGERRSDAQ